MKSTLHISHEALQENFAVVQAAVGIEVQIIAVVKADAYGHGVAHCASVLSQAGATWFGVSDVAEGARVREAVGPAARILIMCGMEAEDAEAILTHDFTPVVWTAAHIRALNEAANKAGKVCRVHLEIDTGMTRQGCSIGAELAAILHQLRVSPCVRCEGVMSHLCCAESRGSELTQQQQTLFFGAVQQMTDAGVVPAYLHLANSSAVDEGGVMLVMRQFAAKLGATLMVRPGLALYGYLLPDGRPHLERGFLVSGLRPVMQWTTRILDLRDIPAGTAVGYGATFVAAQNMRLALLPVGYADGFRRAASSGIGNGWVIVAGQRARVVGRVSMNLTVVDVTSTPDAKIGDEVVLLGDGVNAEDHARWANTIPYEILCGVRGNPN